jgi:hypothetical protein
MMKISRSAKRMVLSMLPIINHGRSRMLLRNVSLQKGLRIVLRMKYLVEPRFWTVVGGQDVLAAVDFDSCLPKPDLWKPS